MKIGILGTGQLAMMLAEAAKGLAYDVATWGVKTCAQLETICETHYGQSFDDSQALQAFIDSVDVLTFDTENIPTDKLAKVNFSDKLLPQINALEIFQDRVKEKAYVNSLNIATANYAVITESADLEAALGKVSFPAILKTSQNGYDGKGQVVVDKASDLAAAWQELNQQPCVLEQKIHFSHEISIVVARDKQGFVASYPVSENHHQHGQLILSLVDGKHPLQSQAENIAKTLVDNLQYVGCLAVELFVVGDSLLVNEVAPRVHNSGHWTLNGSNSSQFAMHIKAIAGQNIEQPIVHVPAAMVNFISNIPDCSAFADQAVYQVYDYGKTPRAMRKLGHINVSSNGQSDAIFYQNLSKVLSTIGQTGLVEKLKQRL